MKDLIKVVQLGTEKNEFLPQKKKNSVRFPAETIVGSNRLVTVFRKDTASEVRARVNARF